MRLNHILLLLLWCASAGALESDSAQEITIQSDRAEFDRKAGTATYSGNVILQQGTLRIDAEQITLFSDDRQKLTRSVASGSPALFQQQMEADKGLTKAKGNKIVYHPSARTITLNESASLEQEGNFFSGDRILYDIASDSVSAKGTSQKADPSGGRVQMIIQPARAEDTPAGNQGAAPDENP